MLTQIGKSNNSFLRKIVAITLFLLSGISPIFCQENNLNSNTSVTKNSWWFPVFEKHKIDLNKFNYKNVINLGMKDTTEYTLSLEMGNSDSLNNRKIPYKDAFYISKGDRQTYWIITSEFARHDLDNNLLILRNGKMACYDFDSKNSVPIDTSSFQEMSIDIKMNRIVARSKE